MSKAEQAQEGAAAATVDLPESSRKRKGWCNHQVRLQIKSFRFKATRKALIKLAIIAVIFFGVLGGLYALMKYETHLHG